MHKKMVIFFLVSTVNIFSINLLLLKDLNKILDKEIQEYTPSNGIPFAEGIAEALYDQSVKSIKKKILESIENFKCSEKKKITLRSNFENYFQARSQEELATLKLVTLLFHKVGAQIKLTEAPNNPLRQLTPKNIGEIFKIILDVKRELKKESISFLNKEEEQKYLLDLKTKLKDDLANYLQSLNFQKSSGSFFKPKDFNPFIEALIGSLWECDEANSEACFAPGTTEKILLAYLLGRSNSKEDLKKYFEALLGSPVELLNKEYTKQELRDFNHKKIDLIDFDSFSDWLTIAFYKKNYMSGLPKMATISTVKYDTTFFPDCVETTIRNLCNIATYNGSLLGTVRNNLQMSISLSSFYKHDKANAPSEVSNQAVHQAWVDTLTNIDGLSYCCLKKEKGSDHIKIPLEYAGFIPVDDSMISREDLEKLPKKEFLLENEKVQVYEKKVGELKYLLVPKKSQFLCFELLPTLSNIVISLHNLFSLNLYKSEEIFDPNFTEKYFESLCHKLNWSLGRTINNQEKMIIKIYKEESSFQIEISPQMHSSVQMIKDETIDIINEKMFQNLLKQKYSRNISLLVPLFNSSLTMQDLFKLVNNNEQIFLQLVRQIRFDKVERKVNIIEQILNMRLNNPEIDRYLSGLILTLPANNGDYLKFILENFKEEFFDYLVNILHQEGSFIFLPLQIKHLNKDGEFDKACSRVNKLRCFSDSINNSLKQYFYMIAANIKRSETIDLLSSLMFFDILSFQEMIPFLKKETDDINDVLCYLILARKVTFQEVMAFVEKYKSILYMLDALLFFDGVTKIDLHELMPFLEKGMNHSSLVVKMETLNVIERLLQRERITFYGAKNFLKKALEEKVDLRKKGLVYVLQERGIKIALIFGQNEDISFLELKPFLEVAIKDLYSENIILVFKVINDLLNKDKITLSQAKPFIKAAIKIKDSDFEKYEKEEAQSFLRKYNKKYEKTLKSAQQGLLKKTKILSMRHKPYNFEVDVQNKEDDDISCEKYENFYNNYIPELVSNENLSINIDNDDIQLSDVDFQEYKSLKDQRDLKIYEQKKLDDLEGYENSNKIFSNSSLVNISQVAQKIALRLIR